MMAAVTGLLIIAFILWWCASDQTLYVEPLFIFFFVGLFLGGCIMAGMSFSELSGRTTGIYYLGVPATHGEKLVCGILFSQVFFNAAYILIFFLIRAAAFGLVATNPRLHLAHLPNFVGIGIPLFRWYLSLLYVAVQTLYLLGSVYFERFAFVKTTVTGAVTIVAFVLFMGYVVLPITKGENVSFADLGVVRMNNGYGEMLFTFPLWLSKVLLFVGRYIWAPVFWVAAYFRLKEKEI